MKYSAFALAAVAAAGMASAQAKWVPLDRVQQTKAKPTPAYSTTKRDSAQARAKGYAEAQRALSGEGSLTPDALAANLAAGQSAAPGQPPAAAQPMTAAGTSGQLNLTCLGAGTANKLTSHSAHTTADVSGMVGFTPVSGYGSANTTIYGTRQQSFADQVDIRLFGGDDRIRMPRTMLPMFHGGSDGWFKLKHVVADARQIHASIAVNFINNPKVYIDRVTGTISISGKAGDYSGECQAMLADAPARF